MAGKVFVISGNSLTKAGIMLTKVGNAWTTTLTASIVAGNWPDRLCVAFNIAGTKLFVSNALANGPVVATVEFNKPKVLPTVDPRLSSNESAAYVLLANNIMQIMNFIFTVLFFTIIRFI